VHGPKWSLTVYPVPRELKQTVAALLDEEGFALIAAWLQERRDLAGREGRQRLTLRLDETKQVLIAEEEGRL
jgi:hypothetical protein